MSVWVYEGGQEGNHVGGHAGSGLEGTSLPSWLQGMTSLLCMKVQDLGTWSEKRRKVVRYKGAVEVKKVETMRIATMLE